MSPLSCPSGQLGSALAHGALGSIITSIGGRKADAYSHLDLQLSYANDSEDDFLKVRTLRAMAELRETSGEWKHAVKALKEYRKVRSK